MKSISTQLATLMAVLLTSSATYSAEPTYTETWISDESKVSYLALSNNNQLRYLKTGSGEPLLLLHTIRSQLDYFEKIIPLLSEHFTVYALDLPGHGYSTIIDTDYTEPYFREAVVQFIERMDLNNLTIVGESIGGVLALTVAAESAQRIKQVYSLNPYDYGDSYGGGIRRSSIWGNLIIGSFGIPAIGLISSHIENRLLLRRVLNGGLVDNKNMPDKLLLEFNCVGGQKGYRNVERSTFSHWQSWVDARNIYENISAPTTLIYGDHDWSLPEERTANEKLIENSAVITLKNAGHFSSLEQPAHIAQIIIQGAI